MPPSTLEPVRASGARTAAAGSSRAGAVRTTSPRWLVPAKVLVFAAGLYPLARLVLFGLTDRLGANPIEFITRSTGLWTLVMLCITLAITPLRHVTSVPALLRFRRMIGLFAFFYATLHFTTYLWFDKWFDVLAILKDVGKRPFITVGFAAFVLLIPLAATSPRAMVRRLGRRWATLHRAIYAIALFGVLHFWWMRAGKHDLAQPKLYATIVAVLLGWRLLAWGWRRVRT
ncbi:MULTISPECIES: protein-methionine-sulfoxide reductase heme-binding subunit MsrQ [Burkholderia]|jgi:sulfoxide reductase heme-binding subunit YedZ|uniref:Protein-methionine-sulfoxide reductase heme-binding subunit MsrQ n=2 Tax=Burkholderia ambifaria TaxID=152480 RepID=A0AA41JLX6_9BURK|nr:MULTISPECIES: protein-methionine-sulfoxide reductase heme-binding subunit MsrQ [Burkholderia]ACB62813.1 Ferric reductase transmembrane component domain protein [Burkholderia ambifaria MC40-6]MBR8132336.1 protein-methionine-sulfoxide reductase heme-binding subunit MsrQ [Burkholderia ambifaria]PRD94378.1 protein-methionine-sulfoxide reductase heme-binding subunit MsrQ [Burkholderia ambifaria]QDW49153.1 protein-methionine-sulfoxide reductase heme-binding subunit MsrQ [Burkholderia sp. KBS0801]